MIPECAGEERIGRLVFARAGNNLIVLPFFLVHTIHIELSRFKRGPMAERSIQQRSAL